MRHEPERDFWARTQEQMSQPPPQPQSAVAVSIAGVEKRFARYPALNGVSLEVAPGELLALLGPSGSGKTTLLRLIAGLEAPDKGAIRFDGEDVTFTRAAERGVGFVFQQYALFKHMTLAKNIRFGLDVKRGRDRPSRSDRDRRVTELLKLVELDGLGGRLPSQLSGGQRQRVALARALAVSPRILLLDEPFGALDATVRKTLRRELRRIHEATGLTTVFVTHDQDEALELSDRVAVLNAGRIEQVGSPAELLERPGSAFVAGFVGQSNRLNGEVRGEVFHALGATLPAQGVADGPATAFIRPDEIGLATTDEGSIDAILTHVAIQGAVTMLDCTTKGGQLLEVALARAGAEGVGEPGRTIRLSIRSARVFSS